VSEYRDSLPDDEARALYDAAVAEAGRILAAIIADLELDGLPEKQAA